jgi:acetyltransferase-like isoleucine patch superfamily enzyme
LRNGTEGPELGKEIYVGEDCWFGGNVIVLPGVRIGKGCSIGAGSVVTKVTSPASKLTSDLFVVEVLTNSS